MNSLKIKITLPLIYAVISFLLSSGSSFAADPYLVEGRNGAVIEEIQNQDSEPEDLFATNFGQVTIGKSETRTFRITNSPDAQLQFSAISSSSSLFVVGPASTSSNSSIPKGGFFDFSITYNLSLIHI